MSLEEKLIINEKDLLSRISNKIKKIIITKAIAYGLAAGLALGGVYCGGGSSGGDHGGDHGGGPGGQGCNYSNYSNYAGIWELKITDFQGIRYIYPNLQVDANGNVLWQTNNYCNTIYTGTINNSRLNLSSNNEHWSIDGTTHCCTGTTQLNGDVITCTSIKSSGSSVKCTDGSLVSSLWDFTR